MRVVGFSGDISSFLTFFVCFATFATGCSQKQKATSYSCSSRSSVVYSGASERSYCTTNNVFSTASSVSGQATFQARPYTAATGLGAIGSAQPIRYAEVVALDSNNNIVQCTETDGSGNYSLDLPLSSSTYKIRIYSRGSNSHIAASVLNCPEENNPYFVEGTVIPSAANVTATTINADATNSGQMLGAAFNIFDQFVETNEFLRSEVGTCGFSGCQNFTVAPKVQAYWMKGFNPNDYFDSASGISFYIPGYKRLFILGGISGDIYSSDTDHFDNSVIVHEYGHFLEDVYSVTDSPGGSHGGNGIIDPRLAWSEGWGNFIQAAVRNQARYRDTIGTPSASSPTSTSSYIFNIPIETPTGSCTVGSSTPGCDIPQFDFEGNFREFSITRMLWDVLDENGTNPDSAGDESVNNKFSEVWASLTSSSGFKASSSAFRNIGLLHYVQENRLTGASDWSSLNTLHKQGDTQEYARYVTNSGGCGKVFSMDPYDDPNDNGSFASSHLVRNNDFLYYHHSGGTFNLTLKYLTTDSGNDGYNTELESDLDLYVYNEDARLGNSTDIKATSETYWDNDPTTEQTESVSKSLPAGNYLIAVKVFTGRYQLDSNSSTNNCVGSGFRRICENDPGPDYNYVPAGDPLTYELILNGVNLCPTAMP